ncbi:MAG TPA: oligosaccharide flippase family protein [Candidatus Butyricicoccus stercorigallinarum]|nr:oligosaccharide flippase family protein [Candidatus Butyricicoccus stercorigallinarum]
MKFNRRALGSKKGVLLKNTIMLYIMQFSTYFLSFIVVPYETRVLGETYYGKLGVATAIMVYFQLVIDFGFILSATEDVARHREDKTRISKILTAVTVSKLLLTAGSVIVLAVLCRVFEPWREDTVFYMLFLAATAVNSLIPDYLYRGLEQMEAITVRTVAIKAFFTVMIVVLLKRPEQYCLIPILNIIGYAVALLCVYWHLYRRLHITFVRCSPQEIWAHFRRSSTFFYSRIATSVYTASNTVILSLIPAGAGTVGYYTLADKLVTTAKSGLSPISDSMYPYMTKNRDFKLVWKILKIVMPVIVGGCAVVFVFARPLCEIVFGAGYGDAAPVLRAMLPVVIVILPSYILGFPTLSAMGLSRYANYSVVFGSALHVVNLIVLYVTGNMNMVTLGVLVSVAEIAILLFRIAVIWKHRALLHAEQED